MQGEKRFSAADRIMWGVRLAGPARHTQCRSDMRQTPCSFKYALILFFSDFGRGT